MLTKRISKEALLRLRRGLVRRQLGIEARFLFRPLRKLRAIARSSNYLSVCIGPTNTAGQAHAWARALRAHCPGALVESVGIVRGGVVDFPCDRPITQRQWASFWWQQRQTHHVLNKHTHVLIESGRSLFGPSRGLFGGDLPLLEAAGVQVALVFHGSDLRDPDGHAEREEFSPFKDTLDDPAWRESVDELRIRTASVRARLIDHIELPVLVTTPGLLDYVLSGRWLPPVIDLATWYRGPPPFVGRRPLVLHIPTNERMKGSHHVDRICGRLRDRGVIDYLRPSLIAPSEIPALVRRADILVDALVLGDGPSVSACQAMATGRLVIGHVSEQTRDRIPGKLPIVEATPASLEDVLDEIAGDVRRWSAAADEGLEYVERFHSGPYSVSVLEHFLNAFDGRFGQTTTPSRNGAAGSG